MKTPDKKTKPPAKARRTAKTTVTPRKKPEKCDHPRAARTAIGHGQFRCRLCEETVSY